MFRKRAADSYSQENVPMFALRIVTVDHYQSTPLRGLDVGYSEFRSTEVKQVPVIRVFGATPAGQKTCLHLHGAFPYIYVPYDGTQPEEQYLHQFAVSLDKAINVTLAKPSSFAQHVYKVIVVCGIPFYGYHPTERHFLKIYFYNPSMVKRAIELLQNGVVMNKIFQPHEAHIPYILQTFIDYNLYGMNLLHLASVKFRSGKTGFTNNQLSRRRRSSGSLDSNSSVSSLTQKLWNADTIPSELHLPEDVVRQSTCELEVDALSVDVLNRNELISNPGVNPGLTAIWEDERHRRRKRGASSQVTPSSSQERKNVMSIESEQFYKQQLLERLANVVHEESGEERLSAFVPPSYIQAVHTLNEEGSQLTQPMSDVSKPVVDEELAASLSQSFTANLNPSQSSILDSQDEALIRLVIDGVGTQPSGMFVNADEDSILCSVQPPSSTGCDDNDFKNDDCEALEMSQQIWETDQVQGDGQNASLSSDEELIPQVDGPIDPKPHNSGASRSSRYRLGPNGRALTARKSTNNSLRAHPDEYDTSGHHFYQTVTHVSYSAGGMYQPYPPPASSLTDPWPYRNYNLWNTNPTHGVDLTACHAIKPAPTHINVPGSQWSPKHPALSVGESSAMDASNPFSDILQPTYSHPQFSQELPLHQGFNCYPPQLPYYNQAAQRTNANVPVCDFANADEQSKSVQPHRTLLPTPQPLSSTGFTCVELTSDNGSKNYISLQRISSAAKDYQEIWPHDGVKDNSEASQYGTGSSGHDDCMLQESYSTPSSNYISSSYEPSTVSSSVMKDKSDTVVSSANSCNLLYSEFQCEPISPAPTAVASPVSESALIAMPSSEGTTVQCLTSAVTTASSLGNWNGTWNCGTTTLTPLGTSQAEDTIESDAVVCTAALSGCQMSPELDVSTKEDSNKEAECEETSGDSRQISIVSLVCDIITSGNHIDEEEEKRDNTVIAMDDAVCHNVHDCEATQPVISEVHDGFECPCAAGMDGDSVLIQSMSPSQIPLSLATVEVETASRFMQRTPVLEKMASFVKTALHQINTDRSSTNSVSTSSPYSVASDSPLSITSASGSPFSRSSENSSPLELCQSQRGSPCSDLHKWNNRTQVIRNLRHDQFTLGTKRKGRPISIRGRGRPPRRGNCRRSPSTPPTAEGEPLVRKRGRPPNNVSLCRPFDLSKATYIQSSSDIPQAHMKLMRNVGTNVHPGELLPRKPQGYYGIKYGDLKVFVPRYVRLVSLLKLGREKLTIPRLEKQLLNPRSGVCSPGKIVQELKQLKQQFSAKHTSGNSTVLPGVSETKVKTKIRLLLPSLVPTPKNCIESKTWTLQPQSSQKGLKIRLRSRNDSQDETRTLSTNEIDCFMQGNLSMCSSSAQPADVPENHKVTHMESKNSVVSTNSNVCVEMCYDIAGASPNVKEIPSDVPDIPSAVTETRGISEGPSSIKEMVSDHSTIPYDIRESLDVAERSYDVKKQSCDATIRPPDFMENNSEFVETTPAVTERTSAANKIPSGVVERAEVIAQPSGVTETTFHVTSGLVSATTNSETSELPLLKPLSETKVIVPSSPPQLNLKSKDSDRVTADIMSAPLDALTVVPKSTGMPSPTVSHCDEPPLQQEINMSPVGVACNRSRRQKVDYNPHAFTHILNYDQIAAGSGRSRGGANRRSRRGGVKFRGCRSLRVDISKLMIPSWKSDHFNWSSTSAITEHQRSKLSLKYRVKTELRSGKCWQLPPILSADESSHILNHDHTAALQATSTPLRQPTANVEVISLRNGTESEKTAVKYELRKSRKSISFFPDVSNAEHLKKRSRSVDKIHQLHDGKRGISSLTRRSVSSKRNVVQQKQKLQPSSAECWSVLPVDTSLPAKNIKKIKIRRSTPHAKSYRVKNEKQSSQLHDGDDDFADHYLNCKSTKSSSAKLQVKRLWSKNKRKLITHFVQAPLISRNVDVTELSNCASDISSVGDLVAQNEDGSFIDSNSNESKESENLYFGSPPRLVPEIDGDQEIKLRQSELPPLLLEEEEELEFDSAEERTEEIGSDNEGLEESLLLSDLSDDDAPLKPESDTVLPYSTDESFCNTNELNIRIESVYSSSVEKFDRLSPCPSSSDDDADKLEVVRLRKNVNLLPMTRQLLQTRIKGSDKLKPDNILCTSEVGNTNRNAHGASSCGRSENGVCQIVAHCSDEARDTVDSGNTSKSADGEKEVDIGSSSSQDLFPSSFDYLPPVLIPLGAAGSLTDSLTTKSVYASPVSRNLRRSMSEDGLVAMASQTEQKLTGLSLRSQSYDSVRPCIDSVKIVNLSKVSLMPFSKQGNYKPLLGKKSGLCCIHQPNLYPNVQDKTPKNAREAICPKVLQAEDKMLICQEQTNNSGLNDCSVSLIEQISPTSKVREEMNAFARLENSEKKAMTRPESSSNYESNTMCDYDEEKDLFGSDSSADECEITVDKHENPDRSSAQCSKPSILLKNNNLSDYSDTSRLNDSQQKQNVMSPTNCEPPLDNLTPGQRIVQQLCDSDASLLQTTQIKSADFDSTSHSLVPSTVGTPPQLTNTTDIENASLTLSSQHAEDFNCSTNSEFSYNLSPDQCTMQYANESDDLEAKDDTQATSNDVEITSQSLVCGISTPGDESTIQPTSSESSSGDELVPAHQCSSKPNESKHLNGQLTVVESVADTVNDCHCFIASLCSGDENSSMIESQSSSADSAASVPTEDGDNLQYGLLAKEDFIAKTRKCSPKHFDSQDNCVSLSSALSNLSDVSSDSSLGLDDATETNILQSGTLDTHQVKDHSDQEVEYEQHKEEVSIADDSKGVVEQSSLSSLWNVESVMNLISESVMQQQGSVASELEEGKPRSSKDEVGSESCIASNDLQYQEAEATLVCMLQQIDDEQNELSLSSNRLPTFSVSAIITSKEKCEATIRKTPTTTSCTSSLEAIPNLIAVSKATNNDKTTDLFKNGDKCLAGICKLDTIKQQQVLPHPINKISSTGDSYRANESSQDTSNLQSFYEDISSDSMESYLTDEISHIAPGTCSLDVKMSVKIENRPKTLGKSILTFRHPPPTYEEILGSLKTYHIPQVRHQKVCYSSHNDPLDLSMEGKVSYHQVCYSHIATLLESTGKFYSSGLENWRLILATQRQDSLNSSSVNLVKELHAQAHMRSVLLSGVQRSVILTPCLLPPQFKDIQQWVQQREQFRHNAKNDAKASDLPDNSLQIATAKLCSDDLMSRKQDVQISSSPTTIRVEDTCQVVGKTFVTTMAVDDVGGPVSSLSSLLNPTASPPTTNVCDLIPHHSTPTCKGSLESLPSLSCTPILKKTPESAIERVCKMLIKRQTLDKIEEEGNSAEHPRPTNDKRKGKRLKMDIDEPTTSKRPRRCSLEDRCGSQSDNRPNTPLYKQLLTTHIRNQNQFIGSGGRVLPTSQLDGPTPNNSYAFKVSYENLQDVKAVHEYQFLTVMSLELHIRTRHDLHPDPTVDPICAAFFSIHNDVPDNTSIFRDMTGAIILDRESWELQNHCKRRTLQPTPYLPKEGVSLVCPMHLDELSQEVVSNTTEGSKLACQCQTTKHQRLLLERTGVSDLDVTYVPSETSLLEELVQLVRKWDPDILVGYEIEMLSWGYLLQRSTALESDLQSSLSRLPDANHIATRVDREETEPEVLIKGRIVLNLWRLMRTEAALTTYSLENVAYHILHQRIPSFSFRMLTKWFDHPTDLYRCRTIKHYLVRVKASLQLIHQLDLVGRTSELARLFGIQFYEVLSRGSQFRVESMMLRMAKPLNFVACSPSIEQRARMRAPECLALIMEPESKFYTDPVVVLDFQSLYPSMMIAYNYCYSTCLGKVDHLGQNDSFDFGCTSLRVSPALLKGLTDHINISPVGVAFVKSNIRQGVLPRMLEEILETRIMVKKAMKDYKRDKALTRVLDARQLGLKLIANVTYGYTSAHFSGRMPCVEVGDSVVSKARETLERAIQLVKDTPAWEAKVVYGDTDSMFIHLPGRSKEEAFRIGQEIADAVTAVNPKPVKLKFEKVYLPCVLQTKKRYVGNMYENVDQKEATFDAKGIETVRRDGCPAVVKILEKSLRLLFSSRDVSQVKTYVQRQLHKLLIGRVSLQDYTFAREYRGLTAYKPAARVPALEIAKRIVQVDRRREPRVGERVPYVIVYGSPGEPLFQLVRQPQEVMIDENLRLNSHYYINNVILPPLERVFKLMNVDVHQWYAKLPRPLDRRPVATRHGTIAKYFTRLSCCVCNRPSESSMCSRCHSDPQASVAILTEKISRVERCHHHLSEVCRSCTGMRDVQLSCISLDCPVFYRLAQASRDLQQVPHLKDLCAQMVEF